jgi:hypothetical protein
MWVIGDLPVVVARVFCETAIGDADAVPLIIETSLEPDTLAFVVDDAVVNIPAEHVHQIAHQPILTAWHITDATTGKSLICASASSFLGNVAAFFLVPPNAGPMPVMKR